LKIYLLILWKKKKKNSDKIPSDLIDFISVEGTQQPVYISFGRKKIEPSISKIIWSVFKSLNLRVIANNHSFDNLPLNIQKNPKYYFISKNSLFLEGFLLSRMKIMIHNGDLSLSTLAIRNGIPSLIIPKTEKQFRWANRIESLGAGLILPHKKKI